ncbi:MAG TPA: cytochrome ubiquinol oxidase subunit I, partial [bacterium]|nr:cytochrome ubiquinol oxidase subunit I [bacterium]
MDVLFLSRLQFAVATLFHFIFVPLTLGLSIIVAIFETRYARTGDELYLKLTKFWGKLFLINFALGVVTGITLEFQFGTNWSRYSAFVGDIFGSLLAIEATVAFFLESTLVGVWIFGWQKLSPKKHALIMWLIAVAGTLSAVWIILANGWMQNPVGYVIKNGRAELASFSAVFFNKYAWLEFFHTMSASYLYSAFFVMGVSAYHLIKKQHVDFFTRSFKLALWFGLVCSVLVAFSGDLNGVNVAKVQPAKLAAMESHWQTSANAPMKLLVWPDEEAGKNAFEAFSVPSGLSLLAFHDPHATVKGLRDFAQEDRPPVLITFVAFRVMVAIGGLLILLCVIGFFRRKRLVDSKW